MLWLQLIQCEHTSDLISDPMAPARIFPRQAFFMELFQQAYGVAGNALLAACEAEMFLGGGLNVDLIGVKG